MRPIPFRIGFIGFLSFILVSICFSASPTDSAISVQVRWLRSPATDLMSLQLQSIKRIEEWFLARGATIAAKGEWVVWCDLYAEANDENRLVVNVGIGRTLPKELIEMGKKAEILFAGNSKQKRATLSRQGRWVRESLTEDFLYEFVFPLDQESRVATRVNLGVSLDDAVQQLYQRSMKR